MSGAVKGFANTLSNPLKAFQRFAKNPLKATAENVNLIVNNKVPASMKPKQTSPAQGDTSQNPVSPIGPDPDGTSAAPPSPSAPSVDKAYVIALEEAKKKRGRSTTLSSAAQELLFGNAYGNNLAA